MTKFCYKKNLHIFAILILNKKNMNPDFDEVKKFDAWLRKIQNIHYCKAEQVVNAYARIESLKHNPAA